MEPKYAFDPKLHSGIDNTTDLLEEQILNFLVYPKQFK